MALTTMGVRNAKPGMHADGQGLYLRVQTGGSKGWIFRFQIAGRRREMGIGTLASLGLADARAEAATLGRLVRSGIDPIEQRDALKAASAASAVTAQVQATTFADCAGQFIEAKRAGWDNTKHIAQWGNTLTTYCAPFNAKPVGDVTIDDVVEALRPIWLEKMETATRVLSRVVSVLDYAHVRGLRATDRIGMAERVRSCLPAMPKKSKRVTHHPALPFERVPAFMAALRQRPGQGARALELAILCASRSGDVRGATWSEVDLDAALWCIPAVRMKMKVAHRVPLSGPAVTLLRALGVGAPDALIFPGERSGRPLSDMTLSAVIDRMNDSDGRTWADETGAPVVPHGFRSSFSTWCSEVTSFSSDARELALAHAIANKVDSAYRRGDMLEKRRELMQTWADFVGSSQRG